MWHYADEFLWRLLCQGRHSASSRLVTKAARLRSHEAVSGVNPERRFADWEGAEICAPTEILAFALQGMSC